jgi:hypothetical protein
MLAGVMMANKQLSPTSKKKKKKKPKKQKSTQEHTRNGGFCL